MQISQNILLFSSFLMLTPFYNEASTFRCLLLGIIIHDHLLPLITLDLLPIDNGPLAISDRKVSNFNKLSVLILYILQLMHGRK